MSLRYMSSQPETPLSKFMPAVAAIPRQTFNAAVGLTGKKHEDIQYPRTLLILKNID
jgi:hypothetical protein